MCDCRHLVRHNMRRALADRIRAYPAEGTSYWRASWFVLLAIHPKGDQFKEVADGARHVTRVGEQTRTQGFGGIIRRKALYYVVNVKFTYLLGTNANIRRQCSPCRNHDTQPRTMRYLYIVLDVIRRKLDNLYLNPSLPLVLILYFPCYGNLYDCTPH